MISLSAVFSQRYTLVAMSRCFLHLLIFLPTAYCLLPTAVAAQLPSLFRGVVVADPAEGGSGSPLGIRVVSVEEASQAYLADLRPEDIIVQINDAPIRSIDEFAVVSQTLKGHVIKAKALVLRNGQPRELLVHLYSYPLLRHWNLSFIPEHDVRFAEPRAGVSYWTNLGRGFETAGNLEQALNASLNALHNEPTNLDVALKTSELLWGIAQVRLEEHDVSEALMTIQQATVMLERLFEQPLNEAQLESVKVQLEDTLQALRR